MAASETISSSWKSPFSTPIRKDENACRDIFQNSEKLLASAVSICRLKGSVECQTGGLITVCEELQSLMRLAFSEIRRLEKHFNSQRSHFEDEMTCLKERVKYLEQGKGGNKQFDDNDDCKQISEATHTNEHRRNPSDGDENVKDEDNSLPEVNENLEESDPNLFDIGSADVDEIPVNDALPVPPKEQKTSKTQQESKKSKKHLKKLNSKKVTTAADSAGKVEESCPMDLSSGVSEVSVNRKGSGKKSRQFCEEKSIDKKEEEVKEMESEDAVSELQESESKFEVNSKGGKGKAKLKKLKKKETVSLEELDKNCQDQLPTDNTNHHKEIKDAKKEKKKRSVDKEKEELEEVFQEENSGDDVFQLEAGGKTKGKKKRDSSVCEKPEEKSNRKLSRSKKAKPKSSSDDTPLKIGKETDKEQPEAMKTSQQTPRNSTTEGLSSKNGKSSKKEPAPVEDKDEQLGDMTFLININSQIALFVADSSQEECELQPMTARERNDVYKVTQLYKLRARIGTKTDNNLTTVRLSKQVDTRMPKPGRVDSLLSELSIVASKEVVKESPKNQVKRKRSTYVEENEQTSPGNGLDQAAPPKKKLSRLSKSSKV